MRLSRPCSVAISGLPSGCDGADGDPVFVGGAGRARPRSRKKSIKDRYASDHQVTRAVEQNVSSAEFLSLAELYAAAIGFVRRQASVIGFVTLLMAALGFIYILTTPSLYTGHAVLLIDTHKTQVFQATSPLGDLPINSATVDTQIEILDSDNIALSIIKDLTSPPIRNTPIPEAGCSRASSVSRSALSARQPTSFSRAWCG